MAREGGAGARSTFVFAYGSNLDPERMQGRVPSARALGRFELGGHGLRFHKRGSRDGTGKANALATGDPADAVEGVVWEIDETDLHDLDRHEGLGRGYVREMRSVVGRGDAEGRRVDAWVYLAHADAIDETLLPTGWYLAHVVRGAREHGLNPALVARLARIPTLD